MHSGFHFVPLIRASGVSRIRIIACFGIFSSSSGFRVEVEGLKVELQRRGGGGGYTIDQRIHQRQTNRQIWIHRRSTAAHGGVVSVSTRRVTLVSSGFIFVYIRTLKTFVLFHLG